MLDPSGWFKHGHGHNLVKMIVEGVWIPRFKASKFFGFLNMRLPES